MNDWDKPLPPKWNPSSVPLLRFTSDQQKAASGLSQVSSAGASSPSAAMYASIVPQTTPLKMTPEQFCYWLQGVFELNQDILVKREQMIKDHLALVFKKVTPMYDYGPSVTPAGAHGGLGGSHVCSTPSIPPSSQGAFIC